MGGGEILKKGILIKSPPLDAGALKMWRRRWFVLLSSKVLEYYKSEGGELKGVINLEDCHSVNSNLSHKRYKHVFNIETRDRVFFMVASSQSDMESWVDELCRVCGLHTDNTTVVYTLPPSSTSSKKKGPNITQPIYATSCGTPGVSSGLPLDSVYSLAAKSEYGTRRNLKHNTPTDAPSSEVTSYGTLDSSYNPPSSEVISYATLDSSQVSHSDSNAVLKGVARNRLSETAFFSPRSGDGLQFLTDDVAGTYSSSVTQAHNSVSKTRSVTLAPSSIHEPLSGLENRSHTNALSYTSDRQQPNKRKKDSTQPKLMGISQYRTSDILPALLDQESAAREEGYGVLHMPPPIDRSRKPPSRLLNSSITGNIRYKTGECCSPDSSDQEEVWDDSQTIKVADEIRKQDNPESQFSVTEIPKVTVRTTHYTQVDIDPSRRRPIPAPRKFSASSSLCPKPSARINYSDVDMIATSQLSDKLNRQMTVREAEQKALAEKHYINVDRSGVIDDETNPDYYTHMRDLYFDESDEPDPSTDEMHENEDV